MRGSNSLIVTFLLLVLIVSAQEGSGSDNDSSDEADVDQTDQISDDLGPIGEEEACDDCEEVISSLEEDTPTSNVTELKVLESASFSMTSVGSTSIYVR